jgi:plastocyanin
VWAIGALPGTILAPAATYDTGSKTPADYIPSNASKSITFTAAGLYQMHCHPHPNMRSNVSVIDGYQGPSTVEVQIYDFGYAPQNIVIGPNTTVVYKNVGAQPHTATVLSNEPPLKALPLKDPKGNATVAGNGWQRVRVYAMDGDGRLGNATVDVYVAPYPTFTKAPKAMSFPAGLGPAAQQGTTAVGPQTDSFATDYNGTIYLNYTAKDAATQNGGPQNLATVDVHLKMSGETQDTLTDSGKEKGTLATHAPAGSYTLSILATQGVGVNVDYTVEVVYDLPTPPAPVLASADGGGAHHHH